MDAPMQAPRGPSRVAVNPVLPGDHPDPSVVRVGGDYYLVTSTFQYFPAVQVLHSTDLASWTPIGHVITRASQLDLNGMADSFGVYAADISYYAGKFWVVVPYYHGQPRCTNLLYVADRPEGPYGEPIMLNHHFIDPSIFNDDDGRRYLVFGGGWVHELAADGSGLIGEAKQVWPGTGGAAPEGPHIVKRDGWYYMLLSEGGTFFDHCCTLARSRSVWGPYEPCPYNPILKQTDAGLTIQKAGHGKPIEDEAGNWWMLHLGGRPLTPGGHCPLGRETFLQRVMWTDDDWFIVGDGGKPEERIEVTAASASNAPVAAASDDDFTALRELPAHWEWVRNPLAGGYFLDGKGLHIRCLPYMTVSPQSSLIATRRWHHFGFEATTRLRLYARSRGEEAGLVLYRDTDGHLLVTLRSGIGQTSGQTFDVSRLRERQEYDGIYLQIDKVENAFRRPLHQEKLAVEAGEPVALRIRLEADSQQLTIAYAVGGSPFRDTGLRHSAVFLYPENVPRWFCFTAPRVGIFARGVYGEAHGEAVFESFRYAGEGEQA